MMLTFYKVVIIESESGWGQRVDEVRYFKDQDAATCFVKEYNSTNTAKTVPGWYMRAEAPMTITIEDELAELIVESYKNKKKENENKKQCNPVRGGD